jgi:hypothetical protein
VAAYRVPIILLKEEYNDCLIGYFGDLVCHVVVVFDLINGGGNSRHGVLG